MKKTDLRDMEDAVTFSTSPIAKTVTRNNGKHVACGNRARYTARAVACVAHCQSSHAGNG